MKIKKEVTFKFEANEEALRLIKDALDWSLCARAIDDERKDLALDIHFALREALKND